MDPLSCPSSSHLEATPPKMPTANEKVPFGATPGISKSLIGEQLAGLNYSIEKVWQVLTVDLTTFRTFFSKGGGEAARGGGFGVCENLAKRTRTGFFIIS